MKKSFVCMSILLALALVLTLFVGCLAEEGKEGAKEEQEWKWYKSKEGGFKFKYPAEWKIKKEEAEDGFYGCTLSYSWETEGGKGNVTLGAYSESTAGNEELRRQSIHESAKISIEASGMKNPEISNITLDGKPAVKLVEKENFRPYGAPETYKTVVSADSKNKGNFYSIFFIARSTQPVPRSWYEEVIRSFEFL